MDKEVIAVVTGASRGAGKGIAIALGESGTTVYVTGRSADTSNEFGGSVFETAQAVTNAGGKGIPAIVDHADDKQVEALFKRVKQDVDGSLPASYRNILGGPPELHPSLKK